MNFCCGFIKLREKGSRRIQFANQLELIFYISNNLIYSRVFSSTSHIVMNRHLFSFDIIDIYLLFCLNSVEFHRIEIHIFTNPMIFKNHSSRTEIMRKYAKILKKFRSTNGS